MHRAAFHCEVLTPMFLAGANQNGAPELRAPSLRGALRYWYRTLLGGRGVGDTKVLREKEARIFGSTKAASKVRVQVTPSSFENDKYAPPGQLRGIGNQTSGLGYLWYFVNAEPNERRWIRPHTRFRVVFSALPDGKTGDENKEALEEAVRAFWLVAHLGGLGTRSRRLAGSFSARLAGQSGGLKLPSFAPTDDYDNWFKKQLEHIGVGSASLSKRPAFSTLHSNHARIRRAGLNAKDWEEVVDVVGRRYKAFRDEAKLPHKIGFGLPINTPKGVPDVIVKQKGKEIERRASPLWMQVVRLPSGQLDAVFTFFNSQFGPKGDVVRVNGESVSNPYRRIPAFVKSTFDDCTKLL